MKIVVKEKPGMVDQFAADMVLDLVKSNPKCVLGLPTGGTPEGMYSRIVKAHKEEGVSFKDVTTFNLDEYIGLSGDCPQSYRYFMQSNLFDHVDIIPENTHVPNGCAEDITATCKEYEDAIEAAGGIDLMVLGVGLNGHIGFNEPGTMWGTGVHMTELNDATIQQNKMYFESEDAMPRHALTMGIQSIMNCKKIMLLAKGDSKAEIMEKVINSEPTPDIPASVLQNHPDVTIVLDAKAAAKLSK